MKSRPFRAVRVVAAVFSLAAMALGGLSTKARADTNQQVVVGLSTHDVYISDVLFKQHAATSSDLNRLQGAVYNAAKSHGVTERIAVVSQYPPRYHSLAEAASALRNFLDLQGVLILVSPRGVGVGSAGDLTDEEMTAIARGALPRCATMGMVGCAIFASQRAAIQAKADRNAAFRSAAIFWAIVIVLLGLVILGVVLFNSRRRRASSAGVEEMRWAAGQTLALADSAVTEIETAGRTMSEDVRAQYKGALGLRNRARQGLDENSSPAALLQANEDVAQAVMALQGIMKRLELNSEPANPLAPGAHGCLYCGLEDRPPYIARTIDEGKGNSIVIDICSVCALQLQDGRTPKIATGVHDGVIVPWWAVPDSPRYHAYGGSAWQYWLPFMFGMDVTGWFEAVGGFTELHGDGLPRDMEVAVSGDTSQARSDLGKADAGGLGNS